MIDAKNAYDRTPLFMAAQANGKLNVQKCRLIFFLYSIVKIGAEDLIKYLISEKADVNARDKYQTTPLHWCAINGIINAQRTNLFF